jgi:hypothetical protein
MRHPWYSSGFGRSPAEDQTALAPYTDYPRDSYLVRISISLYQSEGLVLGSAASFSHLEGYSRITSGVRTSRFQGPPQAAEPRSRDSLPNRARWSDLSGASRNVVGRTLDQQEQDSNPGGWRKRNIYYASRPAPWISQKMSPAL